MWQGEPPPRADLSRPRARRAEPWDVRERSGICHCGSLAQVLGGKKGAGRGLEGRDAAARLLAKGPGSGKGPLLPNQASTGLQVPSGLRQAVPRIVWGRPSI